MTVIDITGPLAVDASSDQLQHFLEVQRRAYLAEGRPSEAVRLDRIDRFMLGVLDHVDELAAALDLDFGSRPRLTSLIGDIATLLPAVQNVRDNLATWMKDEVVAGSAELGTPTYVQTRPKGVVGVIGPWNFPLLLVMHPTIDALAAGNRVMIKFSEIPERTAEVFARAVASRMSPDEVTVVRGGAETASAFSSLQFDHLIFTGSPGVGALVAEAAGRNLVPVTLELGGKNPVLVADDADLADAAQRIAGGRLLNGGQVCLAPDYVSVPRAQLERFVELYSDAVRGFYPTYAEHPGVVSIINERNYERITGLISDAVAKGARAVTIVPDDEVASLPDPAGRRIPPTVLLDVTSDMKVASEEIFGPVIVVHAYDELDEAIDHINAQPSPLAAYWFGSDGPDFHRFLDRSTSGGVTRNDCILHWSVEGAPSGGIGRSGTGAYSGHTGFVTFSHRRTIAENPGPAVTQQILPPAGDAEADAVAGYISQTRDAIAARVG